MRGDIGNLLKQAQAMQENMQKAQAEVARLQVTGEAGAGMVKVTLNGRHEATRVQIEQALMSEEREVLEDLVAAAINDAARRLESASQSTMSGAMGGMQLPPGFKLPF